MHGTGQFTALNAMAVGGAVVTLPARHFRAAELWGEVERLKVNTVVIVGQAFAGPMLDELDARPDTYDLSSVFLVVSSGVMWSQANKDGLLRHLPGAALFDSFGSSEAVGLGGSVSVEGRGVGDGEVPARRAGGGVHRRRAPGRAGLLRAGHGGRQRLHPGRVLQGRGEDRVDVPHVRGPALERPGRLGRGEPRRHAQLLGRGSVCINTGGEKVFPEEVEEVLKTHPAVRDAVAVGLPDERFGEVITAVVEPAEGSDAVTLDTLAAYVKERLAAYKAPRHVVVVDTIGRAPNGKVDYKRLKALAAERVAQP